MLKKRLQTGYDIYNIQSEHVVYRTYSQQPINSFLTILKVLCGMNPKTPANFTGGLFNKGENNTLWLQGNSSVSFPTNEQRVTAMFVRFTYRATI
jgi:hypothetical protein